MGLHYNFMIPIRWNNHPHSVLLLSPHQRVRNNILLKPITKHYNRIQQILHIPWNTFLSVNYQQLSLIHLKHTDMKLFLRILTTSFSIAFTVALFLSILIIAEMKSWTFLWLYVPLFLVVYEMEKINLKKKKHTSSFKYRKYTSLYD